MSVDKRSVVNFVIMVVIICAGVGTLITFGNNYLDETNKITSDIIVTNITLKSFIHEWGWGGYGYYSIIDTQGKGYYTTIGTNNFNKLYIGNEYNITYFCDKDKDNIRRIVNMIDITKNIYVCDARECGRNERRI